MSYYLLYQLFVYSWLLSYLCCSSCSASCLPSKRVFLFFILIFCLCLGHSSPLGTLVISFGVIPIFCLLLFLYFVLYRCSDLWVSVCEYSSSVCSSVYYRALFHFLPLCSFIIIWFIFRSLCLCYVLNSLTLLCYPLLYSCFVSYLLRLFILLSSFTFLLFFSPLLSLTVLISFVPPNSIRLVFC